MEFSQLMIDMLVYVSCKFELYIFKNFQVISENVRIAFLYVLSIHINIVQRLACIAACFDGQGFAEHQSKLLCQVMKMLITLASLGLFSSNFA